MKEMVKRIGIPEKSQRARDRGSEEIGLEIKKKRGKKNAFSMEYREFKSSLTTLHDLNREITSAIKTMARGKMEQFKEKVKKLDEKSRKQFHHDYNMFLKNLGENGKPLDTDAFKMPPKAMELFCQILQSGIALVYYLRFIRDMSLVYLVANFESFMQKSLDKSFRKKPELLSSSGKSVKYEDFVKCKSMKEARQHIIQKEIQVVNQDIEEIRNYHRTKLGMEMSDFVDWNEFKERFYRRNIIVHNSSKPNKLYRMKTGYSGKDERMGVDADYLAQSIELFGTMARRMTEFLNCKIA